jgi:two-component sensor histidine kinase
MRIILIILSALLVLQTDIVGQDGNALLNSNLSDKVKADTIFSIARKIFRKAKFDSADYWLNRGYGFAQKTQDAEIIVKYNVEWANSQYMQGKYAKGLEYIYAGLPFLQNRISYDVHNSLLLIAGNCHSGLQKKDSALKYFFECVEYNNLNFPYRNWLPYTAIGDVFLHTDNYNESEKYYRKAYEITIAKDGKPDHGYAITMFANLYYVWEKPAEFAKLIDEYNQLIADKKMKEGKDPSHNLMMIQWQTDRLEDRVEFITKVKESCLASGAILSVYLTNSYLINLYEKSKQYDKALQFAAENESIAMKNNDIYTEYISNKIKYGLYKKMLNHPEAEKTADRLFLLKDSMSNIQNRRTALDIEGKYESDKKQKEINLLQTQSKLDAVTIARETEKRKALFRENELKQAAITEQGRNYLLLQRQNILKDSIVQSEKAFSTLLASENEFKTAKLDKEKELMQSLTRENILQAKQVKKERQNKTVWATGAGLLLLSGVSILALYRRQRKKNIIIQKQSTDLEVLMKEIHHRVKNNLQVISSLLDLQSMTITDNQASEAVKEGKNRVQSMALIHQNLYSEGNIKGIRTKEYISNLLQSLCNSYNITNDKIKVNTQIDDLNLDVDTMIPLGLVLNELVSNSLKYAFKDGRKGELNILLKEKPEHLLLRVSDNGAGYPEGMNVKEGKSFGMKMIRAFAQKLKAKLDIYNNNGAVVEMQITKYNLA